MGKKQDRSDWLYEVPFVPARDLFEQSKKTLSPEEASLIGVALWEALPHPREDSFWGTAALLEGVRCRI